MLGYAVDVQTGVAQLWSVIATACLVVGSLFLFDGFAISWITLLAGIVGISVSMISGMPAMIRTRFGTPTIGREWMIGTMGEAAEDIKREGVVTIDGAPWKARVNRTTPIAKEIWFGSSPSKGSIWRSNPRRVAPATIARCAAIAATTYRHRRQLIVVHRL